MPLSFTAMLVNFFHILKRFQWLLPNQFSCQIVMQIRTVVFDCRNFQSIRRGSLTTSLRPKSLSFRSHTQFSLAPTLGTWLDGQTQRTDRQTDREADSFWGKKNWCFFLRALSTSAQSLQHSLGFGFKSGFGFGFWFGLGLGFGSEFVFVFGSGLGLSRGFLAWSTLVDRGTESSYKLPCPGIRPLERETYAPLQLAVVGSNWTDKYLLQKFFF